MKRIMRWMPAVIVVAVLLTMAAFTAFASDAVQYTGDIAELTELTVAAEQTFESQDATASDRLSAVIVALDYLDVTPVDPSSEGYNDLIDRLSGLAAEASKEQLGQIGDIMGSSAKQGVLDYVTRMSDFCGLYEEDEAFATDYRAAVAGIVQELLSAVGIENGTARNGIALNRLNSFVKAYPIFAECEGADELRLEIDEQNALQRDAIVDAFARFDNDAKLGEYDMELLISQDFSEYDSSELYGFTQAVNVNESNSVKRAELSGNGYLSFSFHEAAHSYIRIDLPKYSGGTVIEFDLTTFDFLPTQGIEIASSSAIDESGAKYYPGYGTVSPNGKFNTHRGAKTEFNSTLLFENLVVAGEWTRLTFVFNPDDGKISYYINYEYVGSADATDNHGGTHNMHCFRIGCNNQGTPDDGYDGSFAIDNFVIYQGSGIRTVDRISSLDADERFAFYCDYMGADNSDVNGKKLAYDYATEMLPAYWDSSSSEYVGAAASSDMLKSAVDTYLAFDYDKLYTEFCNKNMTEFLAGVSTLEEMGRGLENISNRKVYRDNLLEKLDKEIGEFINREDARFLDAIQTRIPTVDKQIEEDELIVAFNSAVAKFYRSYEFNGTVEALEKHLRNATAAFENVNEELLSADGYGDFVKEYERYLGMNEKLNLLRATNNAKIIVDCVEFIKDYDTQQEWEENYDYINKYVVILRDTLKKDYDTEYEGVDSAIEIFAPINEYFWGEMQKLHIAFITEQLEIYRASGEYVEMMGVCAYVDEYLDSNAADVDRDNPEIAELINQLSIFKDELRHREEDYEQTLLQNTVYFANAMRRYGNLTEYSEKLACFEEAKRYYFAMNVGDESIAELVAVFDEAKVQLEEMLENSRSFINSVAIYQATADVDERFDGMVTAYYYSKLAQMDIDGVAEAMEIFTSDIEAYIAAADSANSELFSALVAMASEGGVGGYNPIMGVIIKIVFN